MGILSNFGMSDIPGAYFFGAINRFYRLAPENCSSGMLPKNFLGGKNYEIQKNACGIAQCIDDNIVL